MVKAKNPLTFVADIYNSFIEYRNDENTKDRYKDKESFYHASGAGSCSRKLWYQSIEQIEPTNLLNATTKRLLRLGTIVHTDLQEALLLYNNNIYKNIIYNKEKENYRKEKETKFHIEREIIIDDLNVRGFYDCVMEGEEVNLIDFKTIGSYPFKLKFGREPKADNSNHQELQLATYGLAVKEDFGRLDGMYLMYYNKDTSVLKSKQVPLNYLKQAELFWRNVKKEHELGIPNFKLGVSPVQDWQCKYCQFLDHCKPPFR